MTRSNLLAILAAWCGCLAFCIPLARAADAPPTTQPTGTIKGTVSSPIEVPFSEMLVYLAPADNQVIAAPTESVKISQKGAKFSPSLVAVCVGQSVEFLNDEDRPIEHNVFSNSPAKQFDLGLFKPGESRNVVFDKPGPVFLYCSIHRYMDGVIYVAPTPYFSRVEDDGTYEIDNIPPGKWTVSTWQRHRRLAETHDDVVVVDNQTIVQDLPLQKK